MGMLLHREDQILIHYNVKQPKPQKQHELRQKCSHCPHKTPVGKMNRILHYRWKDSIVERNIAGGYQCLCSMK